MATGTDIASRLDATHTLAREKALLQAVLDDQYVPIEWVRVELEHRFHDGRVIRGAVHVAAHALRLGTVGDNFRPTVSHLTADRMAQHVGAVLPTARIMDAAAKVAPLTLDPCLQTPGPSMSNTARMLQHSECVDRSIAGRQGMTNTEGKGWRNTPLLEGRPDRAANYGAYSATAAHRGVLGMPLWQPSPGLAHISGYYPPAAPQLRPQGYTDYSQVCERFVRCDMWVEGHGTRDIRDVAVDAKYCWLVSTEGPVILRHPALRDVEPPAAAPLLPALTRTLRLRTPMMAGTDVAFVQAIIGVKADLVFGPKTHAAVKSWQAANTDHLGRRLGVDGIVGPLTRRALVQHALGRAKVPEVPLSTRPMDFDPTTATLLLARHYRDVVRTQVHWIVLHSAEAAELPTTAEALAQYFHHMSDGRVASAHWNFDSDSATRSVPEEAVAYHAKRANRYGVGYEHAGYARQTRAQWLDDYSESMLWNSATTAARITMPRWNIPRDNFVDAAGLKRAYADYIDRGLEVPDELRGTTTHEAVTLGLGGSHRDPGRGYPMDVWHGMVRQAA